MPFYGFGWLKVVVSKDIGSLGPAEGTPVMVYCPIGASIRSVVMWPVLLVLLLRKPNRVRQAWTLLLPLVALYLVLRIVESRMDGYTLFYLNRHACAILCEFLRLLTTGLALLLATSDWIKGRSRVLRLLQVFLLLYLPGLVPILLSAPVVLNTTFWAVAFAFFVLAFLTGHALLHALLRWLSGSRELGWTLGLALTLALGPLLAFAVIARLLSRSLQLQSTWEAFRMALTLSQAFTGPYLVLSGFLLLALFVPFYRRRLAQCFGYSLPAGAELRG